MIEAMGMQADNLQRERDGSPLYNLDDFMKLIDKYGIHHNAIVTALGNQG